MKNLYYTILIALSAAVCFAACSDNQSAQIPEDDFFEFGDELTISRDFNVYNETRAENLPLRFTATLDTRTNCITEYKIQKIEDELVSDLNITHEELQVLLMDELGKNFTDLNEVEKHLMQAKKEAEKDFSISECWQKCHDKYKNDREGSVGCKFTCWADGVIHLLKNIRITLRIEF